MELQSGICDEIIEDHASKIRRDGIQMVKCHKSNNKKDRG
jgi:hypothetical protein